MQGTLHRSHARERPAGLDPGSTLITAAAMVAVVLVILVLLLGVFVTRAS